MTESLLGISATTFWDSHIIKVLDGIAGSGKSSMLDTIFKTAGVEYERYTSTNVLKRSAVERYGGHCDTIAGGLFTTDDGKFFSSEKSAGAPVVVIDEALQVGRKAIEWAEHHRGECNIFLLTDSRQMLDPGAGVSLINDFKDFKRRDHVAVVPMTKTLRARTEETEAYYYKTFQSVADDRSLFYDFKKTHKVISLNDLSYNAGDVYITHTKKIEKRLYQRFNLYTRYDLDLIPKGSIARKPPKDASKYPILPQEDIPARLKGYFQIANIGTPTRYQGSECDATKKLYYIVQKGARVSAREWYTVVTRAYDIRSIVIVECEKEKAPAELKTFWGKPVKDTAWASLTGDEMLEDGRLVKDIDTGTEKVGRLDRGDILDAMKEVKDTDSIHYREGGFSLGGRLVLQSKEEEKPALSIASMLAKEPCFSYSFMADFYKRYEEVQESCYGGMICDLPHSASVKARDFEKCKGDFRYGLDLQASYPHILDKCKLPIDSELITEDSEEWQISRPDTYSFCTVSDSSFIADGAIISVETALLLEEMDEHAKFFWLGACSAKTGSIIGSKLIEMVTGTKESNEKRKTLRYGLIERSFLSGCEYDGKGGVTAYAREPHNDNAPLMWAIKDHQTRLMLSIYRRVYHECPGYGLTVADGIYFDYYDDIVDLGKEIKADHPWCDFRIYTVSDEDKKANIIFKTYVDPPSASDLKKAKEKQKREKYKEKQKACTKSHEIALALMGKM